jgi:hypothetical protein
MRPGRRDPPRPRVRYRRLGCTLGLDGSGDATLALLNNVGELVADQRLAALGVRLLLAGREVQVCTQRVGAGAELRCLVTLVDAVRREVRAE